MFKYIFFWIYFLVATFVVSAQITIDEDRPLPELVQDVLINSSCAETSNFISFTGTSVGSNGINGIGYFNANGSNFPFEEGIVLTTGDVREVPGPNITDISSGEPNWLGDEDLERVTGVANLNASFIQFSFVPQANSISFNFLFASEEYSDNFQCSFSDAFAFILTGPDGDEQNLAVVPGTQERVSVTNIRPGIEGQCAPRNNNFFAGIANENSPTDFQGSTVILEARALVIPGTEYTIKLVIGDNIDTALDSGVFLEGGSFTIDIGLGENRTVVSGSPLCIGEESVLDATALGAQFYRWFRDGVEMPQYDDMPIITVNESGGYNVEVGFSELCISNGRVALEFVDPPIIADPPETLVACDFDGNGREIFDLTTNANLVLGTQSEEIYRLLFFETLEAAELNVNPIEDPRSYLSDEAFRTIFIKILANESCFEISSFELELNAIVGDFTLPEEHILCVDEVGLPNGNLTRIDTGLSNTAFNYIWYAGNVAPENIITGENNPFLVVSVPGPYTVTITNLEFGCELDIATMVRAVGPPEVFEIDFLSDFFEGDNTITIRVEGDSDYLFAVDEPFFSEENVFRDLAPGSHTAFVQDVEGCSIVSKEFVIVDFPRFFTPNGDGVNDFWNILGLAQIEQPEITIYDRFGKLIHQIADDFGWDGTQRTRDLPSSDYWFRIRFVQNGQSKEFRSHFALKR